MIPTVDAAIALLAAIVELIAIDRENESPEHRKLREEIEMIGMRIVLAVLRKVPVPE